MSDPFPSFAQRARAQQEFNHPGYYGLTEYYGPTQPVTVITWRDGRWCFAYLDEWVGDKGLEWGLHLTPTAVRIDVVEALRWKRITKGNAGGMFVYATVGWSDERIISEALIRKMVSEGGT